MAHPRRQLGFTYLGLLALLSVMLMWSSAAMQWWQVEMRREREVELLFVGHEYRLALWNFYAAMGRWPATLEELLNASPKSDQARRFLRRIYHDPMTGQARWGLIQAPSGGIQGVYSLSLLKPIKQTGFEMGDESFAGAEKYTDWRFLALSAPATLN